MVMSSFLNKVFNKVFSTNCLVCLDMFYWSFFNETIANVPKKLYITLDTIKVKQCVNYYQYFITMIKSKSNLLGFETHSNTPIIAYTSGNLSFRSMYITHLHNEILWKQTPPLAQVEDRKYLCTWQHRMAEPPVFLSLISPNTIEPIACKQYV